MSFSQGTAIYRLFYFILSLVDIQPHLEQTLAMVQNVSVIARLSNVFQFSIFILFLSLSLVDVQTPWTGFDHGLESFYFNSAFFQKSFFHGTAIYRLSYFILFLPSASLMHLLNRLWSCLRKCVRFTFFIQISLKEPRFTDSSISSSLYPWTASSKGYKKKKKPRLDVRHGR